jgi:hypothetical protein
MTEAWLALYLTDLSPYSASQTAENGGRFSMILFKIVTSSLWDEHHRFWQLPTNATANTTTEIQVLTASNHKSYPGMILSSSRARPWLVISQSKNIGKGQGRRLSPTCCLMQGVFPIVRRYLTPGRPDQAEMRGWMSHRSYSDLQATTFWCEARRNWRLPLLRVSLCAWCLRPRTFLYVYSVLFLESHHYVPMRPEKVFSWREQLPSPLTSQVHR